MEQIKELVLKEENIGRWITPSDKRRLDYGQNLWANEVTKMVRMMDDTEGFLIEFALEIIPNTLKDHLTCQYSKWDEFQKDIWSIPAHKIKQGKEKLDQEWARDVEIAQLHAQTSATVVTLQLAITQLSQLHVSPLSYAAHPPTQYRNPPPIVTQFNAASQPQPHSAPAQGNWQLRHPPPTREQVLDRVAAIPQYPNSNEGKQQHKADIDAWHTAHGVEAMPSLSRPYLIMPGTALPGSGECFECGMITEPHHTSGSCEAKSHLPPLETKWQAIVAGALRRNPP